MPQCDAHTDFLVGLTKLESALYWIRIFCGGIIGAIIVAAGLTIPILNDMNRAVQLVLHEHGERLTKLEQKHEIMDKFFKGPAGP